MSTMTASASQANPTSGNSKKPINLFQLGCLFVNGHPRKLRVSVHEA